MLYCQKGWFSERSRIYKELSERDNLFKKLDSTFFYFTSPEAGWIDMQIYMNGKKILTCECSNVYDPFADMRQWLEEIVRGGNMETTMRIDREGAEMYLHYEKLREAEVGWKKGIGKNKKMQPYSLAAIGLFFVYDSYSDTIPMYALCETKDFVNSMYLALLAVCGNCYNTQYSDFANRWYYDENRYKKVHKLDNMTFYNSIKSPLIEWNIRSPKPYSSVNLRFRKMPPIKETISMWCDFGDALFWGRGCNGEIGGCCGNAESFFTDTAGEIRLDSIEGLAEWYNEYDSMALETEWAQKHDDWFERGYKLALQVRKLLPDTIDLYYYDWYPRRKVVLDRETGMGCGETYPMIVFNEKTLARPLDHQLLL